jgi:type 2 lantibiotic biosynthesis protein LanM
MQETSLTPSDSPRNSDQAPWYRALTMTERTGQPLCPSAYPPHEMAKQKIRLWKEQAPFQNATLFARRLQEQNLSEQELLALLCETAEALQSRITPLPGWISALTAALERADFSPVLPQDAGFVHCIWPLIADGICRLRERIALLVQQSRDLPIDAEAVLNSSIPDLLERTGRLVNRTLALELHIARLQEQLQGETARERFLHFVQQMQSQERLPLFLTEYAVLARLILATITRWSDSLCELLTHLQADWLQIRALFFPASDPGQLIETLAGAGDTHRGGRSVIKLTFSSGQRLVYKPRSLAIDVHFQALLSWLNARGDHPAFRTLRLLERGTYGWSEYVAAESCATSEEIARFYQRQGAYLALLYALEASDFHYENVIAAGEQPVLVDQEALFHPRLNLENASLPENPGNRALSFSVLRVGLLPQRFWFNQEHEGMDMSGMGGQEGQHVPYPIPGWQNPGTDQMRLIRQHALMPGKENRPRLQGQSVDLLAYREDIVHGFTGMYRLLMDRRAELLAGPLADVADDEIRLIVRSTRTYFELLLESAHPDVLRDALDRERFFDHLWTAAEQQPDLVRVIPAERHDLLAGDIPIFLTTPGSCDIMTSQGEILANYLKEPSFVSAQRQLQKLDEQDLQRQIWLIRASLATLAPDHPHIVRGQVELLHMPEERAASPAQLLAAAHAAGRRLCELALWDKERVSWLGLKVLNERQWGLVPLGPDLYDGIYGIVLFLSYLGSLTHEPGYLKLARQAYRTVQEETERLPQTQRLVGAFQGWGAKIYTLAHLGQLWAEPWLWDEAEQTAGLLAALIEQDQLHDIIGGAAGCLLALLSLYQVRPAASVREAALLCGDHLLARAQTMPGGIAWQSIPQAHQPLTGFAHGAAGISFSLFSLAALSGEERFWQAAQAALSYERSVFSPEQENWPDFRDLRPPEQKQAPYTPAYMLAWCHGAPGIALGRLASLRYIDDPVIRQEIAVALTTTLSRGFGFNHALCHGDLGNLETLLVASRVLDEPRYIEHLTRLTTALLASIRQQGWLMGIPLGVESPGLMTGLAGIGYELLRLAEPEKVPSVLLLAPPLSESERVPERA